MIEVCGKFRFNIHYEVTTRRHVTTVHILGGLKKMFDISRSKKDGAKLDHTF